MPRCKCKGPLVQHLQKGIVMRNLIFVVVILGFFAFVALVFAADWRDMPYPLPNPIYECERVPNPMWSLDDDPELDSRTFIYWAGFTKRPKEKKDYHVVAYNGTLWTVQMMDYKDDGSRKWSELCRGDSLMSVMPCFKAHCRPQRRW